MYGLEMKNPFDKTPENPKTLRHMCNRLRSLGYVVKSTKWVGWESAWRIDLATGQKILYQESGKVTLAPFQRDRRLEQLFNIPGPSDQFARPLSIRKRRS
jgi:hypothetical protein